MLIDSFIRPDRFSIVKYLVDKRYPFNSIDLSSYRISSKNKLITEKEFSALKEEIAGYRAQLDSLEYELLNSIYLSAIAEDDKIRFFNQPHIDANFSVWGAMQKWTLYEAIILLLGKDPKKLTYEQLQGLEHLSEESSFVKCYLVYKQLALARFDENRFQPEPTILSIVKVHPHIFLSWFKCTKHYIPSELVRAVEENNEPFIDKESYANLQNQVAVLTKQLELLKENSVQEMIALKGCFSTTEKSSLYKMILGMAKAKYQYDPSKPRNNATGTKNGSIKADLEKEGLELDEGTILTHLKAAAELLSEVES